MHIRNIHLIINVREGMDIKNSMHNIIRKYSFNGANFKQMGEKIFAFIHNKLYCGAYCLYYDECRIHIILTRIHIHITTFKKLFSTKVVIESISY